MPNNNRFRNLNTLKDFENQFIEQEALDLTTLPKKHKIDSHFYREKDVLQQLDTLYFPKTKSEYKYVLVACDVGTNRCDGEPMKDRTANTILQAYKIILKRKLLKKPIQMMTDGGVEFKGVFTKYLADNKIAHQITTRHRQLAPVDRICAILGKYLNKAMLTDEIKKDRVNMSLWKRHLSKLIEILNKTYSKDGGNPEIQDPDLKGEGDLLKVGTRVRYELEHPESYITSKKLIGNFRAGDIRWSKEIYTIYMIILHPEQDPTYILKDKNNRVVKDIAYHENELQVVT